MCGRFSLTWPISAIREQMEFQLVGDLTWSPRYNIAPKSLVLTVVDRNGTRFGGLMSWGITAPWEKTRRLINARRETLLTRPTFRHLARTRRAIVLADGYYEWDGATKQPYRFTDPAHGLWFFGALYQEHDDGPAEVTIVTTEALPALSRIHPRMPLILSENAVNLWLDHQSHAFEAVLALPLPPDVLCFPVSSKVNSTSAEGPELIQPQL